MRSLRSIAPFDRRLDGAAHTILEFFQLWASWINRISEWTMVSDYGTNSMVIRNNTSTQLFVRVFLDPDEPSFIRAEIQDDAVGTHQTNGHAIMHIPEPERGSYAKNENFIREHLTELHNLFDGIDTHDALSAPIRFWITLHGPYDSLIVCSLVNGNLSSMRIGTPDDLSLSWTRNAFNSLTGVAEYAQPDLEEVAESIPRQMPCFGNYMEVNYACTHACYAQDQCQEQSEFAQPDLEEVAEAILGRMPCFGSYMEVNYACENACSFKSQCQEHSEFDGSRNADPDSINADWVDVTPDGIMEVSRSITYVISWENRRTGKIIDEEQEYQPRTISDTPEKFFRALLTTYNLQESMKYENKAHTRRLVKIVDPEGNEVSLAIESDRYDLIDI